MKTEKRLLDNTQKYRKTIKGVITNIYHHQKERSKKKGFILGYTLGELQKRCVENKKFISLYKERLESGSRQKKPSIDRIDCRKGYCIGNIQVMTSIENRIKGDKEKEILRGKTILQYDIYGNLLKEYPSVKQAVKETGCWQGLISACLLGKRNYTGGFRWKYK